MGLRNSTLIILLFGLMEVGQILCQDSVEAVLPIESLTEETCSRKRNGCCSDSYFDFSPVFFKCWTIHSISLPDLEEKDGLKIFKFFSCFAECIYKKTRFIGKDNRLNMKMVQLEAEKLYAGRPKEKEYYIKSFEDCQKESLANYTLIKNSPGSNVYLKKACRPYFMFLLLCITSYHHKNECPYFRWNINDVVSNKSLDCTRAREKCYAIDGLIMPSNKIVLSGTQFTFPKH